MHLDRLTEPPRSTRVLDNGLRVVVLSLPHLHTTAAQLLVRAGSRYETAETAGLSHFVEHMLYRGSAAYPSTFALNRAIERLGGGLYAETSREVTSYLLDGPPERLDPLLSVLADAVIRPTWSELETEQRIVLEELLEDLDDDGELIRTDDLARGLAWDGHPLGLPIAGTQSSVTSFSTGSVAAHHARHYTGANAVLCVAGPFEAEPVFDAAATHFADLPAGERIVPEPAPDRVAGGAFQYRRYVESQTTLNLLLRGVADDHVLNAAQAVLLRVLDDGLSTRLYRRIVDELGLAYSVSATPEPLEDALLVDINAACAHPSAVRMLSELQSILAALCETSPAEDELEMAQQRLLWDVRASLDNPRALTEYHGTGEIWDRPRTLRARMQQVQAVTADQVREVAREVLQPSRWTLACVGKLTAQQQGDLRRLTAAQTPP